MWPIVEQLGDAVEACGAHNPEVGGSKPLWTSPNFCYLRYKTKRNKTKSIKTNIVFSCISNSATAVCLSVLLYVNEDSGVKLY